MRGREDREREGEIERDGRERDGRDREGGQGRGREKGGGRGGLKAELFLTFLRKVSFAHPKTVHLLNSFD